MTLSLGIEAGPLSHHCSPSKASTECLHSSLSAIVALLPCAGQDCQPTSFLSFLTVCLQVVVMVLFFFFPPASLLNRCCSHCCSSGQSASIFTTSLPYSAVLCLVFSVACTSHLIGSIPKKPDFHKKSLFSVIYL